MPSVEEATESIISDFTIKLKQRLLQISISYNLMFTQFFVYLVGYFSRKFNGSRHLALCTVKLLENIISETKWTNAR